ncbi:uncharacterized protein BDZ99DRAFT_378845 [Mytilinidion resinicola]|uniref:Zn(2)-C6 fungal-type domain-containing protein n=1 Tax=Mytilinidion resinicola TaxID=574789 RepID=A0A6A6Z4C8_9PEZI|nr:uncharacterized protein BDZ99DRAFT_378845 [Mytilinidion resinicola]KAF2815513.1 hypothetical protein BDZ99DRAFT_378845 [Mytilinidion resinicola]
MDPDEYEDLEPETKRRRLRKGTRSCWECKRRKVRCTFASATDATCITCRRRSVKCISQELPEEPTREEDSVGRIVRSDGARIHHSTPAFRTPNSQTPISARAAPSDAGKYEKISHLLLAAFPSQEDMYILLKAGNGSSMFCHNVNVKSGSQLDREAIEDDAKLAEIPIPSTHPVLLARQMLLISSLLLHFAPNEHIHGLSEHHRIVMERLSDTAINQVTTNEALLGTMESLECILLEGFFHLNCGNIRRAWLALRRAMGAAQLMGIDRPFNSPVKVLDPSTNIDPRFMWFRIVYMDRFLSLMLGLPQGNSDVSMGSDTALANSAPSERLERFHAVISARVLERNQLGLTQRAIAMTKEIDTELLNTAECLPAKFWGPPNFAGLEKDSQEAFSESMRVKDQMFHYTLLNQLHLPFLLCPSDDRKNDYSKITCVNASREILTRFVDFRTFNRITACCRLADFLALVAGMTLILAHLVSRRFKETDNLLAHQRLGDRATVEQALENMEVNSKFNEDMLGVRCADLLQHMLKIEADAAQGQRYSTQKVQWAESYHEDERNVLIINVPYFGTIRIAREGIRSIETLRMSPHSQDLGGPITIGGIGSVHVPNHISTNDFGQPSANVSASLVDDTELDNVSPPSHQRPEQRRTGELQAVSDAVQLPGAVIGDEFMQQQDLYPGVAAGMNDWVFQGVDTAFFDSLMKGTSGQIGDGGGDADWGPTWQGDLSGS